MLLDLPPADFLQCQVNLLEGKIEKALRFCILSFAKEPNPVTLQNLEVIAYATKNEKLLEEIKEFLKKRKNFPQRERFLAEIEAILSLLKGDYSGFARKALKAYSLGSDSPVLALASKDHIFKLLNYPKLLMWTLYHLSQMFPQKGKFQVLLKGLVFSLPSEGITFLEDLLRLEPQPFAYLWLAKLYAQLGELKKTRQLLEEGVKKFPNDGELAKELALYYLRRGKVEKAYLLAEKHSLKEVLLVLNFVRESVEVAHSCGDEEKLKNLASQLYSEDPRGFKTALALLLKNYLDKAIPLAGKLWLSFLKKPSAEDLPFLTVYLLKDLELKKELSEEERKLLQTLLREFPDSPLPKVVLAFKLALEGDLDEAKKLLKELERYRLDPYFGSYIGALKLYLRGKTENILPSLEHLYYLSRERAFSVAKLYWEQNSDKPRLWEILRVFFAVGDLKFQETFLGEAVKKYPEDAEVLNSYGYTLLLTCGKACVSKAKTYIEKALKKQPNSPAYLDSLGWAYFISGDYAKAKFYLEKALQLEKEDPILNLHYGWVLLKLGNTCGARKYILKSYGWFSKNLTIPENGFCENLGKLLKETKCEKTTR